MQFPDVHRGLLALFSRYSITFLFLPISISTLRYTIPHLTLDIVDIDITTEVVRPTPLQMSAQSLHLYFDGLFLEVFAPHLDLLKLGRESLLLLYHSVVFRRLRVTFNATDPPLQTVQLHVLTTGILDQFNKKPAVANSVTQLLVANFNRGKYFH